jgi:hypothetical protein
MDGTPELQQELADSNRHIVEGHARIARQREVIGHLSEGGRDVTDAKNLLRTMVEGSETMGAHSDLTCVPPAAAASGGGRLATT